MVRVRFAPSPTGFLHIGNARLAIVNWLFARKQGGQFILRLDDTDLARSEDRFAQAIETDLAWLGLTHDVFFRQSDRIARYDEAKDQLIRAGRLYPCFETGEELEFKRKRQLARKEPPRYDRSSLHLTREEKNKFLEEGRVPHWRFALKDEKVEWNDLIKGPLAYQGEHLSDPVLIRADGTHLYTFTSVVDDLDTQITHVIRGEDHVTNTATQIQLFEALGGNPLDLNFAHVSLLIDASGQGFSKRLGGASLATFREEGIEAMAINSLLARLGTSLPVEPRATLQELVDEFSLSSFTKTQPRFDVSELCAINHKLLHLLPYEAVEERLKTFGIDQQLWLLIRDNIETLNEAGVWQQICYGDIVPPALEPEEKAYVKESRDCLPAEPWSAETWKQWTDFLKGETGRKGKDLYKPLRLALTGLPHGPEMKELLPIIGYERARARLSALVQ